jgi:hypothetical protein
MRTGVGAADGEAGKEARLVVGAGSALGSFQLAVGEVGQRLAAEEQLGHSLLHFGRLLSIRSAFKELSALRAAFPGNAERKPNKDCKDCKDDKDDKRPD